jgi:hypothetical protein
MPSTATDTKSSPPSAHSSGPDFVPARVTAEEQVRTFHDARPGAMDAERIVTLGRLINQHGWLGPAFGAVPLERLTHEHPRHNAATIMINQGVPLAVVSRTLRHKNVATTMDLYGHLTRDAADDGVRATCAALADENQLIAGPGNSDVEATQLAEKADPAAGITSSEAVHDNVAFLTLEGVDLADPVTDRLRS